MTVMAIEAVDIHCRIAGAPVIQQASFCMYAGRVTALATRSSEAALSLMSVLSGQSQVQGGTLRVFGEDVTRNPDSLRSLVGWIPVTGGDFSRHTASEVLRFFAKAQGVAPDQVADAVEETLVRFQLVHVSDTMMHELSSDEKVLLSAARSMIHSPRIVLLNSVEAGHQARHVLGRALRSFAGSGRVVVVGMSPGQDDTAELVDDVISLRDGVVESVKHAASPSLEPVVWRFTSADVTQLEDFFTSRELAFAKEGSEISARFASSEDARDLHEECVKHGVGMGYPVTDTQEQPVVPIAGESFGRAS